MALGRASAIGLGCATLDGRTDQASVERVVRAAWSAGIRMFDTAPRYGAGRGEAWLGAALRELSRPQMTVSTKVGPASNGDPAPYGYDAVLRSVESSLRRLGLARADIVYVHDPDEHVEEVLAGAYPALARLRAEGTVSAIGVAMTQTAMLVRFARAAPFDYFLVAGRYTLLDQSAARELLPLCGRNGIKIVAGAVFNSGILATGPGAGARYDYVAATPEVCARVRALDVVAARHGVSLKAAALQFPFAHPAIHRVLVGSRFAERVVEDVALLEEPIGAAFWQELRDRQLVDDAAPLPVAGARPGG